jgi:aminoglycoside phosphotransferase (APT) family kinase protein
VYRWITGEPAGTARIDDIEAFARDLGEFLVALAAVHTAGGPAAGEHNMWRGAHPLVYDDDVQRSLARLDGRIDTTAARAVWDAAASTRITLPAVWFHGDIAHGNLLVRDGRLAAVIDFGTSGVGDPACDLAIAWTMFDEAARAAFRLALPWDDDVWARGRAWALWKAMLLAGADTGAHDPERERRAALDVIERILGEPF